MMHVCGTVRQNSSECLNGAAHRGTRGVSSVHKYLNPGWRGSMRVAPEGVSEPEM